MTIKLKHLNNKVKAGILQVNGISAPKNVKFVMWYRIRDFTDGWTIDSRLTTVEKTKTQ